MPLPLVQILAVVVLAVPVYIFYGLIALIVRQARSPLRHIDGPPAPSWFLGNLGQMYDGENTDLYQRWIDTYGSSLVYKGFCGGSRLFTTDTKALAHILSHTYNYPKPSFVRASLAMMGGEHGLVVVEGDQHKRQRRILNQAFTPSQIRDVLPIFYTKAEQLRDIFLDLPRKEQSPCNVDVLSWLGRATLDVMGLAGFGYAFSSLADSDNELANAFAAIFSAARKFRAIVVLQAWFPWLARVTESRSKDIAVALATTRAIGAQLVNAALARASKEHISSTQLEAHSGYLEKYSEPSVSGRDLLSVLVQSNLAEFDSKNMSHEEIICQISTFMAAGHETTSSALSWVLYQLSRSADIQDKLRSELLAFPHQRPSVDELNAMPYLDSVTRECLRLHAPVTSTMRSVAQDDVIPLMNEVTDRRGRVMREIHVKQGDIITIPISPVNKSKSIWGADANEFRPDRWQNLPDTAAAVPGVYSNQLTFLGGPRGCIGYRFAIVEMKAFLFVLLRSCSFSIDPRLVIEKRLNIVARPMVKSEPEKGNQMPLMVSPIPCTVSSPSPLAEFADLPSRTHILPTEPPPL